jgi:hypothetical protein
MPLETEEADGATAHRSASPTPASPKQRSLAKKIRRLHSRHLEAARMSVKLWWRGVPRKKTTSMRRVFVTLLLAAGVALVVGTTKAPNFDPETATPLARAILEGVILGSNAWPSTSIDVQARLQLRPTGCDVAERCASSED